MTRSTGILVVDDRPEHGRAIAHNLWKQGYPVLFVEYDQRELVDKTYGQHHGVRVVFMDIQLSSDGAMGAGPKEYAAVQAALTALLDENNGPWALITWSSHDDRAGDLYEFLRERMSSGLRPVALRQIDKNHYLTDDGIVAPEHAAQLRAAVNGCMSDLHTIETLIGWEGFIGLAASQVIHALGDTAQDMASSDDENLEVDQNFECALAALLKRLAVAHGGAASLHGENLSRSLYRILLDMLEDRLEAKEVGQQVQLPDNCEERHVDAEVLSDWSRQINAMLNYDQSWSRGTAPGALFRVPSEPDFQPLQDLSNATEVGKFVRRNFLCIDSSIKNAEKKEISADCQLLLLDVTPPCDHANAKLPWIRFLLACRVPVQRLDHLWGINPISKEKEPNRLKGMHLHMTPQLKDDNGDFVIVVNANLWVSIAREQVPAALGRPVGRVREQLMGDMSGWIGRHVTRQGHTSIPVGS